jgi:signal recognition particle receptor subunit beta
MGEAHARIVLWGIEGSGKSTTLRTIHARLRPESRGEVVRTPSRLDPTIHSESISISLGEMGGKPMQIEVVAVPGAEDQAMTRKQLLDQVDGVILVLDCAPGRIEANASAIDELRSSLADYGQQLDAFPIVLQYNKRDVADPFAIEALHRRIGLPQAAVFETIATTGHGVLPTLTTISKHVVRLRRDGTRPPIPSTRPTITPPAAPPLQTHEILEAGILADAESDSSSRDDGAELEFDRTTQPDWNAVQQELDKPEPALGGSLRIVSVGQASVDAEGALRLPLVLGDEQGQTRSLVLSLRLERGLESWLADGAG